MANPKVKTPRLTKNNRITKIIQQPIRYAVIEMGDYDDVRVFENELKKICGRKVENVSPAAAKEKSFQKDASPWTSYRRAILDGDYTGRSGSEPDWWYWSGHHAGFGDGKYYAESGQYGFFNELYYEAYKKYLYNKQELPGEIANATFMVTSALDSDIDGRPEERKKSNPVYAKSDAIDDCKGLMLIGCNTLSSSKVQNTLSMTFPNALIIGYWNGKAPGAESQQKKHIQAIFKTPKKQIPSLFEDPATYLSAAGGEHDVFSRMVGILSKKTRKRRLAILYKYKLYVPEYSWGQKIWLHRDGFMKYAKESEYIDDGLDNFVCCPVPGKKNPFRYSQGTRYIVGCSGNPNVVPNFRYSEFSKLSKFRRLNSYLAYIVMQLRIESGAAMTVRAISSDGDKVEVESKNPLKFQESVTKIKKYFNFTADARTGEDGRFLVAV
jgi:hypothetical protein